LKILLADDEPSHLQLSKLILMRAGYTVTTCRDGEEVLGRLAVGERFDCFVIDLVMPYLDGYTLIERLRWSGVQAPILAISASVFEVNQQRARESGANGFLAKPYRRVELLAAVREVVLAGEPM
jgi:CheY-like chemotaxis protein